MEAKLDSYSSTILNETKWFDQKSKEMNVPFVNEYKCDLFNGSTFSQDKLKKINVCINMTTV